MLQKLRDFICRKYHVTAVQPPLLLAIAISYFWQPMCTHGLPIFILCDSLHIKCNAMQPKISNYYEQNQAFTARENTRNAQLTQFFFLPCFYAVLAFHARVFAAFVPGN